MQVFVICIAAKVDFSSSYSIFLVIFNIILNYNFKKEQKKYS